MPLLGRQQRQRLKAWREALYQQLATPVQTVAFDGFLTFERLTPAQALTQPRRAFPVGEKWGECWEYAWFTATFCLPASVAGKRVVFYGGVGGEQLVYVNGSAVGSIDREHPYVTLAVEARGGEAITLLIESYAGHGARLENCQPCPPECAAIPPTPKAQCTVSESTVAIWNEEAYQLLLDVETLDRLLSVLHEKSLRAQKVAKALMDFTYVADLELPPAERRESFLRAREVLAPALACHNGTTAPLMWLIGQSHIDLAWLWPLEETYHKSARTYANQLTLMDEYPEYRFLLCEPALLEMLKVQEPALWERTKQAFDRGQMLPEGAFYVECDTNIPSGESLIRQLLWGKRWYSEQFKVDSQVAWQPDTFGYTAALPQILKGMGVPYFATQKLLRADPECERFPYQNFIWEGMDGSQVVGLSFFKNNAPVDPVAFHQRWETDRTQQQDIDTLLFPFGHGDGGGGATRDMLEMARRLPDLEGVARSQYGGLREFFEAMPTPENRWVGELYLAWHRGTYTSQRRTKALMRRAEHALSKAEALLCMGGGDDAVRADVHWAWEAVMLDQFHDVMGGVGIRRTHEESDAELQQVIDTLEGHIIAMQQAVYGIRPASNASVIVNPLPWRRNEWVQLPTGEWCYQRLLPSGATPMNEGVPQPSDAAATVDGDRITLSNRYLRLTLDAQARIVDMVDLEAGIPLLDQAQVMNDWRLYQNIETVYDAWEMGRDWQRVRVDAPFKVEMTLTHQSPAMCEVTVKRSFGASTATQRIRLFASSRRVDFDTEVDWHERRKLLKVHFESNVLCEDALHEIQFGYVRRPTHRSHAYAADRYEVCNHRYTALCEENRGFAVLNDGCYGVSTARGEIALSLLRAPLVPDDSCDRGIHHFTYSLYPFATSFAQSGVTRAGYELNAPVSVLQGMCEPQSGIWTESESVIQETLKPAEDGDGIIVRLYESLRRYATATLHLPFEAEVLACGMDEADRGTLIGEGQAVEITLRPFEIKTLRVIRKVTP